MLGSFARCLAVLAWMGAAGGVTAAQDRLRFVLVTHGAESDPFWATVKQGADQAAADAGVELIYRAPAEFDLDAMAALVQEAIAEKPAGLIVSIPNAEALAAPIRAATGAKIPVISINSGFDVSASLGALLHVGQSEYESGRVAGARMRELGGTKALCVNHELGNVALDLRCKGFIDGFGGSVEVLAVEPDREQVRAKMAEMLSEDAEVDVVLALSASISGEPTIAAIQAMGSGRTVRVGSFDTTEAILAAVADRTAAFAIDQQPFLQGYLPVHYLTLLHRHGVAPVSNVSTGPKLVTDQEAALRLGRAPAAGTSPGSPVPDNAESDPLLPAEPGGG
jgi:simple sugar transport system substrate-binding protein